MAPRFVLPKPAGYRHSGREKSDQQTNHTLRSADRFCDLHRADRVAPLEARPVDRGAHGDGLK